MLEIKTTNNKVTYTYLAETCMRSIKYIKSIPELVDISTLSVGIQLLI